MSSLDPEAIDNTDEPLPEGQQIRNSEHDVPQADPSSPEDTAVPDALTVDSSQVGPVTESAGSGTPVPVSSVEKDVEAPDHGEQGIATPLC